MHLSFIKFKIFNIYLSDKVLRVMYDWLFVIVTAAIAYHGLTYRDENGESEFVRLLFGCIALLFCIRVLMVDIFKLI